MRIVGEIAHPQYKITVFKMNERLSVKIEDQLLEQIYKFRDGTGIYNPSDVESFLTEDFMKSVEDVFKEMRKSFYDGLEKNNPSEGLPEIV